MTGPPSIPLSRPSRPARPPFLQGEGGRKPGEGMRTGGEDGTTSQILLPYPNQLPGGERTRTRVVWAAVMAGLLLTGCTEGVDSTYGRARGVSVNGTGALAEMMRQAGHTVRVSSRTGDVARTRADVLVRFAPRPGPPSREEGAWLQGWLEGDAGRRLIYVPRDFDATAEYWAGAIATMPASTAPSARKDAEAERVRVANWEKFLPPRAKESADLVDWFEVQAATAPPSTCKSLAGPWAEGVDAGAAGVTTHETLVEDGQTVLLRGDGAPLAYQWHWPGQPAPERGAATLVVANGSFLLNEPLAHRARRSLAGRVVGWIGEAPRRVLFLEGRELTGQQGPVDHSPFALFGVAPLGLIFGHWVAVLLLLALSKAVLLGRPRPAPSVGADRPAAHAEALGNLLAKTRDAEAARTLLDTYRRWRHPSASPGPPREPRP